MIAYAQYLDLIYTQYGMLYNKISDDLIPSNVVPPTIGKEYLIADGLISSSSSKMVTKPSGVALTISLQNPPSNPPVASTCKINVVTSDKGKSQQQTRSKKK